MKYIWLVLVYLQSFVQNMEWPVKGTSCLPSNLFFFQLLFSAAGSNLLSVAEPPLFSAFRLTTGIDCCLSFTSLWCSERWLKLPKHHSQDCCLSSFFVACFLQIIKSKFASRGLSSLMEVGEGEHEFGAWQNISLTKGRGKKERRIELLFLKTNSKMGNLSIMVLIEKHTHTNTLVFFWWISILKIKKY